MFGDLVEQRLQLRFAVGQRFVVKPFPIQVETDRKVGVLADAQVEEPLKLLLI